MGIFDRLGDVIKSYLNDEDERIFGKSAGKRETGGGSYRDPDVEAAFEELNDYLGGNPGKTRPAGDREAEERAWNGGYGGGPSGGRSRGDAKARSWEARFRGEPSGGGGGFTGQGPAAVPESLGKDFAELGVPFGADGEACKAAYKRLLKQHHPDRHAGHPGNMQKATEKSARINAAYDRIEKWRATGREE
jgi:hypothetical protein